MRERWVNVALAAAMLVVATVTFWGTRNVAPPSYEPLGSGAFPRIIAACIAVMALMILVQAARARRAPSTGSPGTSRRGVAATVGIIVLAVVYAATMAVGLLDFRFATTLFVVASGMLLKGGGLRTFVSLAALGLALGFGGHFVATRIVVIDLP
jgi:putative tricarboxylic transport membrane protein